MRNDDVRQSGTEPSRSAQGHMPDLNLNTDVNGTGTWLHSYGSPTTPAAIRGEFSQSQLRAGEIH